MLFQRIYTDGLAQASFLLGSESTDEAVVIDPRRDVDVYLSYAKSHQLTIRYVLETHIHADFASGARELAARSGATACLSAVGETEFAHQPLNDGDVLTVGELQIEALLTPGHTPEHLCFLVRDTSDTAAPAMLFSGDALFVGAVGRPDLLGEEHTRKLADALYDTIHERLMALNDDVIVYPGHGAGSACGKAIGDAESTTMGQEKRFNYAFQPMDREAFVRLMLDDLPLTPVYFPVMKQLNKAGPAILNGVPQPPRVSDAALAELVEQAGQTVTLVDVRTADEFGAGYLRGSLNIGVGDSMANWAGWSVPYDRPIVLVVADESQVEPAVTQLIRIGLDDVSGYVVADVDGWESTGLPVDRVEQLVPAAVEARLASDDVQLVDVRNKAEFALGHIDGAVHLPVEEIARGTVEGVSRSTPIIVTCAAGYRSSLAASLLKQRGFEDVANLSGGMGAWALRGK
ncbi:MAG: rhodanese-like domain-containing protein [Thermomicrobiales bacterium]|nr:rhodanese-like domain-containing protein [Thermomicrobiales bacterium]